LSSGLLEKSRDTLISLLLIIPVLFLILSLVNILGSLCRINITPDRGETHNRIESYLASDRADVLLSESPVGVAITYRFAEGPDGVFQREIPLRHEESDFVIYAYGSSPIVSVPPVIGAGYKHFPELLESRLNSLAGETKFKVYNFGMKWADSYGIGKIAEATIGRERPDLAIVYYEGGADYELAYRAGRVKERYYLLKSGLMKWLFCRRTFDRIPGWKQFTSYGDWFVIAYIEPVLINLAQKTGFIRIDRKAFDSYDMLVTEEFGKNMALLGDLMRDKGVPAVFVTALDNITARPFGIPEVTDKYYLSALKKEGYKARMVYFMKAAASEIFTGDIRAKPEAYEFLRNMPHFKEGDLHLFDLRKELMGERFGFGYGYFYDYGHPKPETNNIIADRIYEFMLKEGMVSQ